MRPLRRLEYALFGCLLSFLVIGSGPGYLTRPGRKTLSESEKIRDLEAQLALCISADGNITSVGLQREQRHDMHLVCWRHNGYQYVLTGRNPEQQSQSAQLLRTSLSA